MELRVAFTGAQPILRQNIGILQIDGLVKFSYRGVVINHFEVLATRAGFGFFPADSVNHVVDEGGINALRQGGVKGVAAQLAVWRGGRCWFFIHCDRVLAILITWE